MGDIEKLHKTKDANDILDNAKDCFDNLLVIGWDENDDFLMFSNDGMKKAKNIIYTLEHAKAMIMVGAIKGEVFSFDDAGE